MQKWHKVVVLAMLATLLLAACERKEITGTVVEKMMATGKNGWMYVEVNTDNQNTVLRVNAQTYLIVEVGGEYTFRPTGLLPDSNASHTTWTLKSEVNKESNNGS